MESYKWYRILIMLVVNLYYHYAIYIIPYHPIQYHTKSYNIIQHNTIYYTAIHSNTLQYTTIPSNTIPCNTIHIWSTHKTDIQIYIISLYLPMMTSYHHLFLKLNLCTLERSARKMYYWDIYIFLNKEVHLIELLDVTERKLYNL